MEHAKEEIINLRHIYKALKKVEISKLISDMETFVGRLKGLPPGGVNEIQRLAKKQSEILDLSNEHFGVNADELIKHMASARQHYSVGDTSKASKDLIKITQALRKKETNEPKMDYFFTTIKEFIKTGKPSGFMRDKEKTAKERVLDRDSILPESDLLEEQDHIEIKNIQKRLQKGEPINLSPNVRRAHSLDSRALSLDSNEFESNLLEEQDYEEIENLEDYLQKGGPISRPPNVRYESQGSDKGSLRDFLENQAKPADAGETPSPEEDSLSSESDIDDILKAKTSAEATRQAKAFRLHRVKPTQESNKDLKQLLLKVKKSSVKNKDVQAKAGEFLRKHSALIKKNYNDSKVEKFAKTFLADLVEGENTGG